MISSDLQSIAAHPAVPSMLDLPYTRAFLADEGFQHPTRTLIQGVRKVPPAHILVFDRDGLRLQRYWDPAASSSEPTPMMASASTSCGRCSGSRSAVGSTRIADGAGAHLSGGLDSSSISVMRLAAGGQGQT